jgi:peptidylprolyl isomerase
MADTKLTHRAFALTLAILFLVTSVGFSFVVIWELTHNNVQDNQPQTNALQCQFGSEAGQTEAVPEVFKPTGTVTQLEVTDLKEGSGAAAKTGDCLVVKYHGTLAATGEKFDGNFDEPTALKFPLGEGSVIPGWDQGLMGMKVGSVRRLVIPAGLGYGDQAAGSIPANSDLVFVVELLKIN